jgi:hypothetical protein
MKLQCYNHHTWVRRVSHDPFAPFGKHACAKLRSVFESHETPIFEVRIAPLTESFLDTFIPFYEAHIREKTHPHIFPIRENVLHSRKTHHFSLSLTEGENFVGGTIFSCTERTLSIAYRAYTDTWDHTNIHASPALVAEYLLNVYAHEHAHITIIHGKDRNPYGTHSSIGVAIFKLSVGFYPFHIQKEEAVVLDTDTLTEDALILLPPKEPCHRITNALLFTTPKTEHEWVQVTKYPHQLQVEVRYR